MFETTFFKDVLATVIHRKGARASADLLDDPNATFVWGALMDPHFVRNLLGHYASFSPAVLKGFERKRTIEFFDMTPKLGSATQGVVLLGLSDEDVKKLDEFERVGDVMRKTTAVVRIGHKNRKVKLYLKIRRARKTAVKR